MFIFFFRKTPSENGRLLKLAMEFFRTDSSVVTRFFWIEKNSTAGTGQDVLPSWRPEFVFADACTTDGVKSGCDSSGNGFPDRKWRRRTRPSIFVLGSKSFCCTAAIHSARLCRSFEKEKRWFRADPALAQSTSAGNHHTRLRHFLGEITPYSKHTVLKSKKEEKNALMAHSSTISKLTIKQWNARTTKFWGAEVSSHNSRYEPP